MCTHINSYIPRSIRTWITCVCVTVEAHMCELVHIDVHTHAHTHTARTHARVRRLETLAIAGWLARWDYLFGLAI